MITPSTSIAPHGYTAADLRELHRQTVEVAVGASFGLAIGILAFATFGLNRVDPELFGVVVGLLLSAAFARGAMRHGSTLASVVLVSGLIVVFAIALRIMPARVAAPWLSLIVLLASALIGWRWGAVIAVASSVFLLLATWNAWISLSSEIAASAVILSFSALFVSWMTSRPTRTALDWASSSYLQAFSLMEDARKRQAELFHATKSLSESYYVLEQLNLDLERARRAAHEARRLKAQFAAAVSHELRTPLNLIIGFCEMMVLSPTAAYGQRLPAGFRDDLDAIYRNACHISALVDDILDLSQIDADRMALHREWTTIHHVIDEAIAPVATLFRNRALRIEVDVPNDLPAMLIDRTRVRQILINLLNNAARLVDRGGVNLSARREGESIVIAVADTGPGIAANDLAYIFEEFRQVGDQTRRRGGNGLGLAVSKRFAELHGGTMWVDSVPGQGSTFYLRLPIDKGQTSAAASTQSWDDRVATRVRGQPVRQILVVDDTGEMKRLFESYLDGYHVLSSSHLDGVVGPLQAVIVGADRDHEHRGEIRQGSPEWQRLPTISCALRTTRWTAAELGANGYLVKPFTRDQLRSALGGVRADGDEPRTALVVEDDPEMRRLLARMVRSIFRDCQVRTASNGTRGLASMRARPPEVVLLDLLMPSLDGYKVIQAMRSDPRLQGVPTLVVTARGVHSETVVVDQLTLTRDGGLTVAEVMRWLKGGLDALLAPGTTDPAPREVTAA